MKYYAAKQGLVEFKPSKSNKILKFSICRAGVLQIQSVHSDCDRADFPITLP